MYLDGKAVGEHTVESEGKSMHAMWDEPFDVEISRHLQGEGPRLLAVRVHNEANAGGLCSPVYLVLSDRELDVSEQIRAISLLGSLRPKAAGQATLLEGMGREVFRDDFERYAPGDDPTGELWSYGEQGNNQGEGDTTYVDDGTLNGVPAYQGRNAFYLQRYVHNNQWDVVASPIAKFPRQTSGVLRVAFAVYPTTSVQAWLADAENAQSAGRPACAELMIRNDGTIAYAHPEDGWKLTSLAVEMGKWNTVIMELDLDNSTSGMSVNGHREEGLAARAGAADRLHFRLAADGAVWIDAIAAAHQEAHE